MRDVDFIGFVFKDTSLTGDGQGLDRGCTTFKPGIAGQVSSFIVFDHWACNFYRSSDCGEGFMFEAGNRSDLGIEGKDNDAAQSTWCNTF